MQHTYRRTFRAPQNQRGAVLYVALIMLILLALIGVAGMQVTGLQERMAYNYRTLNLAFQNAEADARAAECIIEAQVNRTVPACGPNPAPTVNPICDDGFDANAWALERSSATPMVDGINVRAVGQCMAGNTSLRMGEKLEEDPNPVYQVTAFSIDDPANAGANAAVDTIFRP